MSKVVRICALLANEAPPPKLIQPLDEDLLICLNGLPEYIEFEGPPDGRCQADEFLCGWRKLS